MQSKTIYNVRTAAIQFLVRHGVNVAIASEYVTYDPNDERYIYVTAKCANNEYTAALAVLQLAFSSDRITDRIGHIQYRPGCTFRIAILPGSNEAAIEYLDSFAGNAKAMTITIINN